MGDVNVIELNCRFDDPETQANQPLLETPLYKLMLACAEGRLTEYGPLVWKDAVSACVVAASGGYPGSYKRGLPIAGSAAAEAEDAIVFHAGTYLKKTGLVTDGGQALGVTAINPTFDDAFAKAYHAIEKVEFDGIYYRRDIGHRVRTA